MQPLSANAPTLTAVIDLNDGRVTFRFSRTVTGVGSIAGFVVGGEAAASLDAIAGTDVRLNFTSAPFAPGTAYTVSAPAAVTFSPAGTPAYPLTGVTT